MQRSCSQPTPTQVHRQYSIIHLCFVSFLFLFTLLCHFLSFFVVSFFMCFLPPCSLALLLWRVSTHLRSPCDGLCLSFYFACSLFLHSSTFVVLFSIQRPMYCSTSIWLKCFFKTMNVKYSSFLLRPFSRFNCSLPVFHVRISAFFVISPPPTSLPLSLSLAKLAFDKYACNSSSWRTEMVTLWIGCMNCVDLFNDIRQPIANAFYSCIVSQPFTCY